MVVGNTDSLKLTKDNEFVVQLRRGLGVELRGMEAGPGSLFLSKAQAPPHLGAPAPGTSCSVC